MNTLGNVFAYPQRMDKIAIGLFLFFSLIACSSGLAQNPRLPFTSGEKLLYNVSWRLLPAGHAEILLMQDAAVPGRWKVTGKAESVGYVSNIYKVNDEYQSTFR